MLSWCIYQTRIVRVTKKLTLKLLERKMQQEKKYNLIVKPRDLLRIMTEGVLFHSFRTSRLLLWSLN